MIASKAYTCETKLLSHAITSGHHWDTGRTLEQHPPNIKTVITAVASNVEPLSTAKWRATLAKVGDGGPLFDFD